MKIEHKIDVGGLRRAEYPDVGEQLDAVFKMAKSLRDQGIRIPDETIAWIASCEAVKQKYPS